MRSRFNKSIRETPFKIEEISVYVRYGEALELRFLIPEITLSERRSSKPNSFPIRWMASRLPWEQEGPSLRMAWDWAKPSRGSGLKSNDKEGENRSQRD
jgi:hypothetical protein